MGIIKASMTAISGALADQWKEAFCAGEMGSDLLITRATKIAGQDGGKDVITDGSLIIVGEGECAIATEGGKVIGIYDQPGEQIFKSNQSGGIFGGGLGAFAKDVGRRISFGGDITISQRLYYINTKELTGGTIRAEGIPLRFRDARAGIDMDCGVSCSGVYTFRVVDPERFYKAAIRSVDGRSRRELLGQMDSEVLTSLAPALAQLAEEGLRPSELMEHTRELCDKLREIMSSQWSGLRGLAVVSVALESVRVLDAAALHTLQRDAAFQDPKMAAAHIVGAQADAMQTAAANPSAGAAVVGMVAGRQTADREGWYCTECGVHNSGKFCTECGTKKPACRAHFQCAQCGWKPEDKTYRPKFCPECGAPAVAGD